MDKKQIYELKKYNKDLINQVYKIKNELSSVIMELEAIEHIDPQDLDECIQDIKNMILEITLF